jgi:hypothetical protein
MMRSRILMAAMLAVALTTWAGGTAYAAGNGDRASFCADVQEISTGFLALENTGGDPDVIKDLVKQYKTLEREAPKGIKQPIRVIRTLAEKLWKARPANAAEAAEVMTPDSVRKLTKASKKLGTYLATHCR